MNSHWIPKDNFSMPHDLVPFNLTLLVMFLKNYGRVESLGTTTCLRTVFGVSKGMLSLKYFPSNKAPLC